MGGVAVLSAIYKRPHNGRDINGVEKLTIYFRVYSHLKKKDRHRVRLDMWSVETLTSKTK